MYAGSREGVTLTPNDGYIVGFLGKALYGNFILMVALPVAESFDFHGFNAV